MEHIITRTLTEWSCTCKRYGVLITVAEREAFSICPSIDYVAIDRRIEETKALNARIEHYRARGEDYSDAIAWAMDDLKNSVGA